MQARVIIAGRYVLEETARGDRLLSLDAALWLRWTGAGPEDTGAGWLARAPAPGVEEPGLEELGAGANAAMRECGAGEFLLITYVRGPMVGDALHLFLADGPWFGEYLLPEGMPVGTCGRRRIIATGERLDRAEVLQYVANVPAPPSPPRGHTRASGTTPSPPDPPAPP